MLYSTTSQTENAGIAAHRNFIKVKDYHAVFLLRSQYSHLDYKFRCIDKILTAHLHYVGFLPVLLLQPSPLLLHITVPILSVLPCLQV